MTTQSETNELTLSRFYDAPVKAVWDAWTDPKQVEKWWGPRGFTLTTHSKDLRVGGHWHYTMHGPDGTDYPNRTTYFEVEPEKKLVYDHGASDDRPPLFRVTVLFSPEKGGTRMDMTMALATAQAARETRAFIKKAGGEATWDRLAEYLAETGGKEVFVINRSFEAPVATLFDMWTTPTHIAQWLPPSGFRMDFLRADIRPGGRSFYSMTAQNGGMKMFGRADYLTIEKPHTIVYTQQFCDEHENLSRHPLAPLFPATLLTHVRLTEEGPGRTRVTVTWAPYGEATRDEIDAFLKMRAGMTQGWTGSFDKLEGVVGGE